jgi:hypothetical protein
VEALEWMPGMPSSRMPPIERIRAPEFAVALPAGEGLPLVPIMFPGLLREILGAGAGGRVRDRYDRRITPRARAFLAKWWWDVRWRRCLDRYFRFTLC